MDALKALDMIEQMENDICDMYVNLQAMFSSGESKDLEIFFYRLYLEQSKHVTMTRTIKQKTKNDPDAFGYSTISADDFKTIVDQIAVVRGMPRDRVSEIMMQCYLIELNLAEQYAVAALKTPNEEIKRLFEALGQGFRSHLAALAMRVRELGADMTKLDMIRRTPRVSFSAKALINEKIAAKSVDISESGLFLLTLSLFDEGALLSVSFPLLGGTITTNARVRYLVQNAGIGLSFDELTDGDRAMIREYVDCCLQNINVDSLGSPVAIDDDHSGTA
jgi:hypothetical protein